MCVKRLEEKIGPLHLDDSRLSKEKYVAHKEGNKVLLRSKDDRGRGRARTSQAHNFRTHEVRHFGRQGDIPV